MAQSKEAKNHPLLLLSLLFIFNISPCFSLNNITNLPGFDGPLPFYFETGYVEVDEVKGVELFYYFIKSEGFPAKDPLLLWLTGGPGCSAFSGLVFEIGPLQFDVAGYTEGLPSLVYNPLSWTKVSSIIFLDSPVDAGFSYAKKQAGYVAGDLITARQILVFLKKWLSDHPEFISNPLYIGGDSYSGITVPVASSEIVKSNHASDGLKLNLKGYLVGNGATDYLNFDGNSKVPFAHGMGLISDEMYEAAKNTCGGQYLLPPNPECAKNVETINECLQGINVVHILEPLCGFASPKRDVISADRKKPIGYNEEEFSLLKLGLPVECRDSGYRLSYVWADDGAVREALGIRKGSIGSWMRCNYSQNYANDFTSVIELHRNLTAQGYQALIYSGDHDMDMPFVGTEAWVRSLGFPIVDDWRSWWVDGQVAGLCKITCFLRPNPIKESNQEQLHARQIYTANTNFALKSVNKT
ncbi:serine carboxypeptidase-like 2 isoform X2 [Ananas comosus]|uniref:Serine carboxypeptidase-like 2 isoform X2 n=1 Tax=Ananas comosus TaxID=4615 RepID=A0A6P5EKJ5_ANACO|nr:serine carboxypeptidase-like 2 isoform X2 [Ananas comosus]